MVKDLELIRDISPLFEKEMIIWGIGNRGRRLLKEMKEMGIGKKRILLCDSKSSLWGECYLGHTIMSPDEVKGYVATMDIHKIILLVTVLSVTAQDEIIARAEESFGRGMDVYTEFAVEWGMYFGMNDPRVDDAFRQSRSLERKASEHFMADEGSKLSIEARKYLEHVAQHDDEIILVYQPGKVGSTSVYKSIQQHGRHVLHCHSLDGVGSCDEKMWELLDAKHAKIISLIRDPVARQIAAMWQNMYRDHWYSPGTDFSDAEQYYFREQFYRGEFRWFDAQIKRYAKIDIFEHPFDVESGHSIIKKGNIELLLMKVEKLDGLEDVIGKFLGIDPFCLCRDNIGAKKRYRFAYRRYKETVRFPPGLLEKIYRENDQIRHFYSREECEKMYGTWSSDLWNKS